MKKKSLLSVMSLLLVMSLFLAACGGNSSTSTNKTESEPKTEGPKTDAPVEGGVVTYAIDGAPEGIMEAGFYGSSYDADILSFMTEGIYKTNKELKYEPNLADWEVSEDKLTYTFKFKEGVKWHNGEELTVEDWKYALEVLAHKDYTGPRFVNVEHVKGAAEYREGKADSISGIEVVDPYTIKVTFKEVRVNNLENLWSYPMPKKHYEGIAVADLQESKQVRQEPVGLGAFKVKKVVNGEYVELERFDDYWQGKSLLDGIIVKVIDPSLTAGALQKNEIDLIDIRPTDLPQIENLDNVEVLEGKAAVYSYIGLRFGHRDQAAGKNVADFDKFENKELRQALLYAIDRQAMIKGFMNGKAVEFNTVIPSVFWIAAEESELNPYKYDPEKAKSLLAEAGYKDVNGDGFVEDPSGKEFKISFGHYAGPANFEGRAKAIIQAWNDIGIQTEMATGSLIEFNLYNEMKDNDDKALEAFFGSWGTGSDPDPNGLWGSHSEWNYGRWVNEESDKLILAGLSEQAFDDTFRKDTYVQWQKLFNDELPALPLWENMNLYAVNKRLQGVTMDPNTAIIDPHKWSVTE
ncbi:oligopeptide ABC transporter substrate-binding protein [Metabacillus iocasae]|uniref:Peptide/nickel transport system substrate-binding protein n=1 Tax=Priestia iocasae TaxID=2291674 RepID=A0ABS2QVS2_9BACI|nr:oligopeptide ABC transporter substrate-binding protein [Metabacillus iocasae]MBM7702574.1 peptide/nickel transport system substrate-binding protein [Metabacillus iocasae]